MKKNNNKMGDFLDPVKILNGIFRKCGYLKQVSLKYNTKHANPPYRKTKNHILVEKSLSNSLNSIYLYLLK